MTVTQPPPIAVEHNSEGNALWMLDDPTRPVQTVPEPRRRRLHGLRLTALPSWPLVVQGAGGGGILYGVYRHWGVDLMLIVGGVAAVVLGALREGNKI